MNCFRNWPGSPQSKDRASQSKDLAVSIKVEGPGSVRTGSVRRGGRSDAASRDKFSKLLTEETSSASGVGSASAVATIDSLLALQEVEDSTARASRGRKRAMDMLDKLDDLRHGLLSGEIPPEKLIALSRLVQSQRAQVDDPKLAEILDEIDLRAQVELAKLGH